MKKVNTKSVSVKLTKEQIAEKRLLNPQFSHLVSKQKKNDELEFKSNPIKVLLSTKAIVKNINIESYSLAENLNLIEKSISVINFIAKTDKSGKLTNDELFKRILKSVRTTKKGLYVEFYFSQLVQKIATLQIAKKCDTNTAINLILAIKK
tara:strand:- start:999 stop:1451 length:453 start_codon:yes stop_codon:yes gene_type:complete